ncbi:MAG TPA: GNAT family N-acetyltransferase [Thermoplasmata archaeon]|nr:GNAT family N-acetyltransferase [Thermoplasmata archaeon]
MDVDRRPSIVELPGEDRARAIPVILDCFTGVYRWHAKRTLGEVSRVRASLSGNDVVGLAMLEVFDTEVGYVYYVAVRSDHRGRGIAGALLDDALALFRSEGRSVAYVATEEENVPMIAALARRGFRKVERRELGYAEGGLGAWGLRSRMTLVGGEILMGLRLRPPPS